MPDSGKPGAFIPHDTVAVARPQSRAGLNDLFLLSGVVLLVASGALAVAVFLYSQFLSSEVASKVTQLQRAEAAFEPSLIQQLTRLDDRMHAADFVLRTHIAPTQFFKALNAATLQTVAFQSLDFDGNDAQHMVLKMQGIAQSVNSIALQADIFSKNGVITNPIFANIARQADGVHFDLTASVNAAAVGFVGLLSGAPTQSAPQTAPAAAADTSSPPQDVSPFGGSGSPDGQGGETN